MFPSPCDSHHASIVWHLHIYFTMNSVPDGPLLSSDWFCGRHWPSHKAQQHLKWCDMACRVTLFPAAAQGFLQAPV